MIYAWQQPQWQQLMRLRQSQRLPHAMLLYGSIGTGKHDFARALGQALLCKATNADGFACGVCEACHLLFAGTHPDLNLLRPEPPENSTSKTPLLSIRIEAIRRLCSKLSVTSQYGGYRIAIIEQAEHMASAAANSLLKTLEEPGERTLLLLVTSRPHRLPVTIRSRCQALRFAVPEKAQALSWLQSKAIDRPDEVLNLAHGAPLLAASIAEHQLQGRELLATALLATINGGTSLEYAQKLAEIPKQLSLAWLLDWVADLVRLLSCGSDVVLVNEHAKQQLQQRASRADLRRAYQYHDIICGYIRAEAIALNPQLLWENLLLSWEDI